jgi:hypothetical protein
MEPTQKEYEAANIRLEQLIVIMDGKGLNNTQEDEFDKIGEIIEPYEKIHFSVD